MAGEALFVSYAREDVDLLRELRSMAEICFAPGEWFDDSRIEPGQSWADHIARSVGGASLMVVLVSHHSLASDYIWDVEVRAAAAAGVPVTWLKVRDCPWELSRRAEVLKPLQALVDPQQTPFSAHVGDRRDRQLADIVRRLHAMVRQPAEAPREPAPERRDEVRPADTATVKVGPLARELDESMVARRQASLALFEAVHDLASAGRVVSVEELNSHPAVIAAGLAAERPMELRRSIMTLVKAGLLPGVELRPDGLMLHEEHFALKAQKQLLEKEVLAEAAVERLTDGAAVLLDAGSTTLAIVDALAQQLALGMFLDLKIATHSPIHAVRLMEVASGEGWTETDTPVELVLIGGHLRPETEACVEGDSALGPVEQYEMFCARSAGRPIFAFVGANGVSVLHGYSTADCREASIKRVLLDSATYPLVVADGQKIGKRWPEVFGHPDQVPLLSTTPDPNRNPSAVEEISGLRGNPLHTLLDLEGARA